MKAASVSVSTGQHQQGPALEPGGFGAELGKVRRNTEAFVQTKGMI
ncbi:MAG: hypothetical protein OXH24_00065 [Cyanobacteria bacterium MAG IRC3_bin_20]|nr:hypothetical protein [Cyanobacteria bacterium MAG IRC3_bin_20]